MVLAALAIFGGEALFGFSVALMFGIAMIVLYVWTMLGWLDGFNLNSD